MHTYLRNSAETYYRSIHIICTHTLGTVLRHITDPFTSSELKRRAATSGAVVLISLIAPSRACKVN
jgi:hypothetical protein